MENKKLLKFLYKDIAEIEELFSEKGSEGFDEYEIEFIQSRFKGAKQIVQILSEKENKQVDKIRPRPIEQSDKSEYLKSQVVNDEADSGPLEPAIETKESKEATLNAEVKESLNSLSEFEAKLKEDEPTVSQLEDEEPLSEESELVDEKSQNNESQPESDLVTEKAAPKEEPIAIIEESASGIEQPVSGVELEDESKVDEANHRLGDSFFKEKSVNELLAGDVNKLEYKISNSPVKSIKTAIGINDRYQYIRELFEGNAEAFSKTVSELDSFNSINEAVSYLQQNYKWKKNETSLKFVSLVKRRFSNE